MKCDGIQVIDGLHVPYSIDNSDPERPGLIVFWGDGYATDSEAKKAIERTEAGEVTPAGIRVDMDSGKRIGPTLAQRLQRTLEARGCNISEAARLAGMERQQVWRIVTGETPNPGVLTVERLVAAIGSTMGELFADPEP
jgi:DNA-binding phage protein